jgi:hypothetical protein
MDMTKTGQTKAPAHIPQGYRVGAAGSAQEEPQGLSCAPGGASVVQANGEKVVLNTPSACDVNTLALLFVEIYKAVNSMPEGAQKNQALQAVVGLEIEARKGGSAAELDVENLFIQLKSTCPVAGIIALETFSVPRPGINPLFQAVASRVKKEK